MRKRETINVDTRSQTINILSLCAGGAGLDLGFKLAVPNARTICYVEIEAFNCALLVEKIEAGLLADAPVWTDLRTFDGRAWRGAVDCIIAGFPCQPHSAAGKRKGTSDERWIWPDIARIIRDVRPHFVFLENVPAITLSGFNYVLADLAAQGFSAEWDVFSAAQVGAPHLRERIFILGYSDKRGSDGNDGRKYDALSEKRRCGVAHAESHRNGSGTVRLGAEAKLRGVADASADVADSDGSGCESGRFAERSSLHSESSGLDVGNTRQSRLAGWTSESRDDGAQQPTVERAGGEYLAVSESNARGLHTGSWRPEQTEADITGLGMFPPRPNDRDEWARVLAARPDLAPAIESSIRGVDDGLAGQLDPTRTDRLRTLGNGVIPIVAAVALRVLGRRLGIVL